MVLWGMAFHLVTDGSPTERAATPWASDLDGYTSGFFLMARVRSSDLVGFGDDQTIAAMWRSNGVSNLTFRWFLDTNGKFQLSVKETANTILGEASGVVTTDQGVDEDDTFWVGVSVRFSSGALTQWYWGGTGASPSWVTWGAESSVVSGVLDMVSDGANSLTIGDIRPDDGPQDEWNGRIYEYRQFNDAFGLGTRVAYFNAADFSVGDGTTDTAVGQDDNTWTLTGSASMIADDSESESVATVTFTTYDTPWGAESVGHGVKHSLWRWYDGFRTARTIIITGGVATASPGNATATVDA
ncbi:hypothetical protein LCGC14_3037390, partial [marine sediment metagenome]